MQDGPILHKCSDFADLPAMLRLGACAGSISVSLTPELAIRLARDLDAGQRAVALAYEASALRVASQQAVDAAMAAMEPIRSASEALVRLTILTALRGAAIGALVAVAVLDQLGWIAW